MSQLSDSKPLATCFVCGKQGYENRNDNNITFTHSKGSCSAKIYSTFNETLASTKPPRRQGISMTCPKCGKMGKGRNWEDLPGTWRYLVSHPRDEKCYYNTFTAKQKKQFMKILKDGGYQFPQ